MSLNNSSSRLSLVSKNSFSSNKLNKLLFFEDNAKHHNTEGKLRYEIEKAKLKFSVTGEISADFRKKYNGKTEIEILKSNVKKIDERYSEKEGRWAFKITLKNKDEFDDEIKYFSFYKNKSNPKIREKFIPFLTKDHFEIYKLEFQKMDIKTQKKICFFMKNKELLIFYKRLSKCYCDPEKIFQYMKYIHPEKIDINLGLNRIQLSRDEELIMSLSKKFNVNKLLSSDCDINEKYHEEMEKNKLNRNEFWEIFYDKQKEHATYLVGEYNPAIPQKVDKINSEEINNNNLMEELEKDKYYYDTYESNYLYYNDESNYKEIKTVNNYSINKMKEINYFSYSPICINIYNNKNSNKNKIKNKSSSSTLNQDMSMEIEEEDINKKETSKKKRLTKAELNNKIAQMRKEYNEKNNKKNNINNTTIKTLIEEIDKLFNLVNIMNYTNNNSDDMKEIYSKILSIKDLSMIYDSLDKRRRSLLSSNKKMDEKTEYILQQIKNDMKNIYSQLKKKENEYDRKSPFTFLLKYAKYNIPI